MINLSIDTLDLSQEFDLNQQDVDGMLEFVVEEVTSAFARKWDNQAKTDLNSTREQYRSAIQVTKKDRFTGVVYLNPAVWIANALELGIGAFDMKSGFLASSKVKYTSKGTPFLTIPFRFATAGSIGENTAFAGVMPTVISNTIQSMPVRQPLTMGQIPKQYHIPQSATLRKKLRSKGFQNLSQDVKVTSIYEGLRRNQKGSGYVMFRRVSLNSDPDRFIHPGFEAKRLAEKALSSMNIPQTVDVAIDSYLANLGF